MKQYKSLRDVKKDIITSKDTLSSVRAFEAWSFVVSSNNNK